MYYETHDMGNFYWHKITLKKKSTLVHKTISDEAESPYRRANALIFRLPGTSMGIVCGFWRHTGRTEDQMILDSVGGREISEGR
jgi:hypothetical protein